MEEFEVDTGEVEILEEPEQTADTELTATKEQYLRLAAEFDNYKKRTEREKTQIYADAYAKVVSEFLPVLDNLERALSAEGGDFDGLYKGVALVLKQTLDTFAKMDVEEIDAQGQPFDPELHNAVMHGEDENLPENTVSEVLQKGYKMGDKVIRYATVKVVN